MAKEITIADYRREAGLTQVELAERLGCTVTYISLLENDHRSASKRMKVAIEAVISKEMGETVRIFN